MIKFFRKIRYNLMEQNKTGKYLKYAIGEIVLVVIGILIALSINNWNENRYNEKQLNHIITVVSEDLKTDLVNIEKTITFYEELDSFLMDIINTEYPPSYFENINEENYVESIHSVSRISMRRGFNNQQKGIKLLNLFVNNNNIYEENLSGEISKFYASEVNNMQMTRKLVLSFATENFRYLEQFSWFKDYIMKKYNPDTVWFFAYDPTYKNKAASFLTVAVRNHLSDLKVFKKRASELIEKITKAQQRV